ncbi:MAG: 23S rRNA (uracil(1939)-C(5))-methyltransferase RlmD [Planctomycetes bacterium]|nr:23S rRNA (uracil(1939)-C(5))-methyltransferase RlmD [Planctomycetota bacterium]
MCRHFGNCGGCSALDVPLRLQLDAKLARVAGLLEPFLGAVRPTVATPPAVPLHFRTKLLYPVRPDAAGRPTLGIYARGTHDLVQIEECRTQDRALTALGTAAERVLRELRLQPFDERDASGFVRAFHARVAPGTGELLMGVVTRPGLFDTGAELAGRLLAVAAELPRSGRQRLTAVGVVRSISERTDNFLLGERHVPLRGRDHIVDRQDGLEFRIGLGSFYQVHRSASAILYRPALELLGELRGRRVVDGYGGIGTFGLRCARAGAARVEIVEDNPSSCRDAEHNIARNGLGETVSVERAAFVDARFEPGPDVLIVDPPRSGLREDGCERTLRARPRAVLHVACSAEALARDLAILVPGGYRVAAVRLCDMFPHTEHVEVLTLLTGAS